MSRKISIELTSDRGNGIWTWRAAGAKQPKGDVAASMLPEGAAVGAVFTAEIETDLGEMNVLSVTQEVDVRDSKPKPETIEVTGTRRPEPEVVTTYAKGKSSGGRGGRGGRGQAGGGRGGRGQAGGGRGDFRGGREAGGGRRGGRSGQSNQRRWQKLNPNNRHQQEWLSTLTPEKTAVAQQLMDGGMASVRAALQQQSANSADVGPDASPDSPLLELAKELQGDYWAARWRDRLDAVMADFDRLSLGDIRSVVAAADELADSPETQKQADEVKQRLAKRLDIDHTQWLADLASLLSEGQLYRALRLSGSPPKVGVPLPADLASWLADDATQALAAHESSDTWIDVLEVLALSPVRRLVRPEQAPDDISPKLRKTVDKLSERLPGVVALFADTGQPEEKAAAAGA